MQRLAPFGILIALLLTGCSASRGEAGTQASASCAFLVSFDGRAYQGVSVWVAPPPGRPIGSATLPGCNDTGQPGLPRDERVRVAEIPGVDPRAAVAIPGDPDTILVHDPTTLPDQLARLVIAPSCTGQSFGVSGQWTGIIGADGHTEVDLRPPYNITVRVASSTEPGYERATLTIRVPETLGMPLSRLDVRHVLWKGGTITVAVTCDGDGFVATAISAPAAA